MSKFKEAGKFIFNNKTTSAVVGSVALVSVGLTGSLLNDLREATSESSFTYPHKKTAATSVGFDLDKVNRARLALRGIQTYGSNPYDVNFDTTFQEDPALCTQEERKDNLTNAACETLEFAESKATDYNRALTNGDYARVQAENADRSNRMLQKLLGLAAIVTGGYSYQMYNDRRRRRSLSLDIATEN